MSCNCTLNKYQLISNEGLNHYTLTELMRLVNGLILDPSFSYAVSNLDELNEIFKFYPTKEETIRILQGETGITPQRQNLNDYNLDYAWLNYYTKEEVITFIAKGYVPEKPPQTYTFTINPVPASATVVINGIESDTVVVYKGEQVLWTVSENGYTTKMGVQDVEEDTTIEVSLTEYEEDDPSEDKPVYTVCVETEPSDAYVFINGERENCFSGAEGTVFDYTVQAGGYVPQSGKITVNADKTVYVMLEVVPEPETPRYTFTINPVPASATVIIDGQVRNNITVESGTVVNYSVQAEGYFFQEGSYMVTENYVLDVELEALPNYVPNYYFTINPTPSDATVVINGNEQSTYEAQEGSIIVWSVSKEGYISQSGTYVMGDTDYTINISLEEYIPKNYTLTINPTPSDATVIIDGVEQSSITVQEGTVVTYTVEKQGYHTRSESLAINSNTTLNVILEENTGLSFTITTNVDGAEIIINDLVTDTYYADSGTVINWSVSADGYVTKSGSFTLERSTSMHVILIGADCNPQTVSTLAEYQSAGSNTGVIDLCTYDLTPYTGELGDGGSYLTSNLTYFEGDLTSNGRTDLSQAFFSKTRLETVGYVGDTSNVTNMSNMFTSCTSLSDISPLANWNVSNVTNMYRMFYNCDSLSTLTGLENWDVSSVEDMTYMFSNCDSLTNVSALSNWDVSSVTDMEYMFYDSKLSTLTGLENWDVSSVTNMLGMFYECNSLSDLTPLENWDVSSVTSMNGMFTYCYALTNISALSNWNTSSVTDMYGMFIYCDSLTTADLSNWDISNVTNMYGMFNNCASLTEVRFGGDCNPSVDCSYMFYKITTTGTLYYPAEYADNYARIINAIPSTWTAVAY